jgi:dihydroneopterin aldolase
MQLPLVWSGVLHPYGLKHAIAKAETPIPHGYEGLIAFYKYVLYIDKLFVLYVVQKNLPLYFFILYINNNSLLTRAKALLSHLLIYYYFYMKKFFNSVVSLDSLQMKVNLGVTEEERNVAQDVKISFKLYFETPPKACYSDELKDTICYHEIANIAREHCTGNHVKLLEYLCMQLHAKVRKVVAESIKIWIKVEKCNPPIKGLMGSTSFEYCDF